MNIAKFDINKADDGHNGTIKSHEVLPESWAKAPFKTAWGYLPGCGQMEGHTHPEDEIYMIFKGQGIVTVDLEQAEVLPGDIVEIPAENIILCKMKATKNFCGLPSGGRSKTSKLILF